MSISPQLLKHDNKALSLLYRNCGVVLQIIWLLGPRQTKVYLSPWEVSIKKDNSMDESPKATSSDEFWLNEEGSSVANLNLAIIIIAVMLFFGVWALGVSPFENPLGFLMAAVVFLIVITVRYGVSKALFGGIRK